MIQSLIGMPPPSAVFAELIDDQLHETESRALFAHYKAVIIGVPGAFTPICTRKHLPDFVANADRLRASGVELVVCITPNDPWVNAAWSQQIDPQGKIRMLSDGNLDFARALGMTTMARDLHAGERSRRYLIQMRAGKIDRATVERSILDVSCTRSDDLMLV
jgi:2-Cys peroxiredoxin 5